MQLQHYRRAAPFIELDLARQGPILKLILICAFSRDEKNYSNFLALTEIFGSAVRIKRQADSCYWDNFFEAAVA